MTGTKLERLWLAHRDWLAMGLFVAVVLVLSARTWVLLNEPNQPDPNNWGMRDYRDAVYFPVVSWIDGHNPYHAQSHLERYPVGQLFPLYSPLTLLIHLPLGLLPFVLSEFVYFFGCITLTILLSFLVMRMCQVNVQLWSLFGLAALLLISRGGHMNQVLGQTAIQATLFSWLAIHFADRSRWLVSGIFLMLATFKPTFGIILIPLLLAQRKYAAAATGIGLTIVVTGLVGLTILDRLPAGMSLGELMESNETIFQQHIGVDSYTTFSRDDIFPLLNKTFQVNMSSTCERLVTAIVVLISAISIWFCKKPSVGNRSDGLTTALICVTVIVSIYHHTYDTLLLCLPWLAIGVAKHPCWANTRAVTRWGLFGLLTVPAVNYLSTNTVTSAIGQDEALRMAITSINGFCLLIAWFILVILCWTSPNSNRHETRSALEHEITT